MERGKPTGIGASHYPPVWPADRTCLEDYGDGTCEGPVEWRSIDPVRAEAFPRCEKHWGERLDRREQSIERYETSDVPPDWFDPAAAGETWDDGGW